MRFYNNFQKPIEIQTEFYFKHGHVLYSSQIESLVIGC